MVIFIQILIDYPNLCKSESLYYKKRRWNSLKIECLHIVYKHWSMLVDVGTLVDWMMSDVSSAIVHWNPLSLTPIVVKRTRSLFSLTYLLHGVHTLIRQKISCQADVYISNPLFVDFRLLDFVRVGNFNLNSMKLEPLHKQMMEFWRRFVRILLKFG